MEVKFNISLARYTTYKVGGNAKIYFKPNNLTELSEFIGKLPNSQAILWLGLGSNLLIRDGGFDGVVIHTQNTLQDLIILDQTKEGMLLQVGAGLACAKLAKFCIQHNLADGIWFAGIPGTLGGALRMNAGAFGGTTWEHVMAVQVMDHCGNVLERDPEYYVVDYRDVRVKAPLNQVPEWFVGAKLFFKFNLMQDQQELFHRLEYLLQTRKNTQPIGTLNCGSVFKNPSNHSAGKLIEMANLKGTKLGNAIVSEKHANFIINLGGATAMEIENLINLVQQEVFCRTNILLQPEVKIVGST